MKCTLLELAPLMETDDLDATIKFYTHYLGFQKGNYSEDEGWVHLTRDGIYLMFSMHDEKRNFKKPIWSGSLYFRVDHVDMIWIEVKSSCAISYPIENLANGMREFGIYDNNGYLLQFGQEIGWKS